MTRTSGENRSGTLRFCSQPRLVKLLSVGPPTAGLDSWMYFLCPADGKVLCCWRVRVTGDARGRVREDQLGAPPLFSPNIVWVNGAERGSAVV